MFKLTFVLLMLRKRVDFRSISEVFRPMMVLFSAAFVDGLFLSIDILDCLGQLFDDGELPSPLTFGFTDGFDYV